LSRSHLFFGIGGSVAGCMTLCLLLLISGLVRLPSSLIIVENDKEGFHLARKSVASHPVGGDEVIGGWRTVLFDGLNKS